MEVRGAGGEAKAARGKGSSHGRPGRISQLIIREIHLPRYIKI